jgi:hypothetical protein
VKLSFLLPLAAVCYAQSTAPDLFHRAPPDVEEALRGRIATFYKYHIDGKFRLAEALVAEDTKDFFYSSNKPRYLSCEVSRIDYSDQFTKAKVTMVCETYVMVMGFGDKPLKVPFPSRWKLENGQWCWYVDQDELLTTPFGKMKPPPPEGAAPEKPALPPQAAMASAPDINALWSQVKPDKSRVEIKAGRESTATVTIANGMPGSITLSVDKPPVDGLEATLDKAEVKASDKAILTIRGHSAKPLPRGVIAAVVTVRVQPTNQAIPVQVAIN